jgi:hypothetical protein
MSQENLERTYRGFQLFVEGDEVTAEVMAAAIVSQYS